MSTKELQSSALHDLSVAKLARRLRAKELSAVEAATHFLGRIEAHGELGAFLKIARAEPLGEQGDVLDRYYVRLLEMRESLKIIEQCLEKLPAGEFRAAQCRERQVRVSIAG